MKKKIFFTILGLLLLAGGIAGIKTFQIKKMINQGKTMVLPPEVVTAALVQKSVWESTLNSVGSLVAVQGVTVAAELPGKVVSIAFEPGSKVNGGDLLIKQDSTTEEAQLRSAEAQIKLAQSNFNRIEQLLARNAISRADFDNADAQLLANKAQADAIRTAIAKKNVHAPFSGRLGLRLINLGEILKEGTAIVSLQTLNPIFANFQLPQHQLSQLKTGYLVRVTSDALAGQAIDGKITAINPQVDSNTRNISIQATLENAKELLRPGMFVDVQVVLPEQNEIIAIPATSILYAPYSDSVFVVDNKTDEKTGQEGKAVRQQFVRLGEKRGDFIAVLSGLKESDTIVTTGVFKLRNGQSVVIDNKLVPEFKLAPKPTDS
ncbi:MAG: efflux RND transporter periplasmic adaptor subunit [Proteobacteria bacterium]|nr:efflux RND transporter periplasmic adaptor subunit [Pseudomonadota bacterium]